MNALEKLVAEIEGKTQRQISKEYNDALQAAMKRSRDYFKRANDVDKGRIKPPPSMKTKAQIDGWKQAYKTRAAKQAAVVERYAAQMQSAGVNVRQRLKQSMTTIYDKSRKLTFDLLNKKTSVKLPEMSRRQIESLLYGKGSTRAFSKIAFNRLGSGKNVAAKLRREMAQSIANGESQEKLLQRIMKITGAEENDAKRILRTESTQVQSMAQQEAADEHYRLTGRKSMKRWCCAFINSRDTHMEMDGQEVPYDEPFRSPSGALLMYPGDNSAPPEEVINCQCWMEVFDVGES